MQKTTTPKLLIFDLDGTLIDSAPDIVTTVNELMNERGRPKLPDKQIIAAIGEGLKQLVFSLFPETHGDEKLLEELEAQFFSLYEKNLLGATRPYSGVESFLANTEAQIAVVTNKHERLARKVLEGLGLMKFPWLRIFGADTFAQKKPDPFPLLEVVRAAGLQAADAVMIGDGIPDMVAARRAGIHSIGCLFGYTPRETLLAQGATELLKTYDELPQVLMRIAQRTPRVAESV